MSKVRQSRDVEGGGDEVRSKRVRRSEEDEENEQELERIVLGNEFDVIKKLNAIDERVNVDLDAIGGLLDSDDESDDDNLQTKEFSEYIKGRDKKEEESEDDGQEEEEEISEKVNNAVWQDDDDEIAVSEGLKGTKFNLPRGVASGQAKYKDYLESKFSTLHQQPKWATNATKGRSRSDMSEDEDDDDDLERTAGDSIQRSKGLDKDVLSFRKCSDLNFEHYVSSIANCVQFHPTAAVGLVSHVNGMVNLFKVDGNRNTKLQSIKLENYAIDRTRFSVDGRELYISSTKVRGKFYSYDMMAGKVTSVPIVQGKTRLALEKFALSPDGKYIAAKGSNGLIHVLSASSKEVLFEMRMNDVLTSLEFSPDSSKLFSHGCGGRVYIWDIGTRRCINKFEDEGSITGTSLAMSPNGHFLAAGSDVGIVNIYRTKDLDSSTKPKPLKVLKNLTTDISSLKFNTTSELLTIASSYKDNAIRIVHVPSFRVFSNFPAVGQNLRRVTEVDISPNSGYMTFGNNKGKASLVRLCHFGDF